MRDISESIQIKEPAPAVDLFVSGKLAAQKTMTSSGHKKNMFNFKIHKFLVEEPTQFFEKHGR